ncbi:MAG TPA: DMT family transporter [Mycobacterium sp.]|nr:DMT family transporter [Mycobacterium sp.]
MSISTAVARRGLFMLVVAGVLWGTGGLLGQLLATSTGMSALAVAALRLAVGGGLILACLWLTGRPLPRSRAAWLRIGATGLLAATFQASYFTAVTMTSVSLATLITIGAAPVIVLLARLRAASRGQVVGTALALLGLVMLIGLPTSGPASGDLLAGAACAVLAGAGFAVMTLLGTRPVAGLDNVTTTGLGFTVGGLVLSSIVSGTSGWSFVLDVGSVALLLALAIIPTALAYTCYFRGLRTTSAGTGSVLALLEPLTGTVLAALLLGERLGASGLIAGAVLALAMVLTARAPEADGVRPV